MLLNLQNLFQTEDNEAWVAGQEDHLGIKNKKKKKKTEGCRFLQNYGIETKLLDPLQQR